MRAGSGRARFALLALATILACLGMPAGAGAAGWGPEFGLSDTESQSVATHMTEDGRITFIAAETVPSDMMDVFATRDHGNATDGTRHTISTFDRSDPDFIQTGQDADGRVSLLWVPGGDPFCGCVPANMLKVTRLDADGAPLPQPLTVADYSAENLEITSASYAVRADGHAVVAATVADPVTDDARVEIFVIDPGFTAATKITSPGYGAGADVVRVATNASGQILAAWRIVDTDADQSTIEAQHLTAAGPVGGATMLYSIDNTTDLPAPVGALLADDGDGTIAFSPDEAGAQAFRAVKIAPDGSALPAATLDQSTTDAFGTMPGTAEPVRMGLLADGSALFVSTIADAGKLGLRNFIVARDGSVQSHDLVAPDDGDLIVVGAGLGLGPDGTGGILYSTANTATEETELVYQPLDRNGAPIAAKEKVAAADLSNTLILYFNPRVTTNAQGDIGASWTTLDFSLSDPRKARARIYDSTAPIVSVRAPAAALVGTEVVLLADVADRNETATSWDFGDGQSGDGEVQAHAFDRLGTYEIKVKSTDSLGNTATVTKRIRVVAEDSGKRSVQRPNTRITRPPRLRLRVPRAAVRFTSDDKQATFECRVGRGPIAGSRQAKLRARGKGRKGLAVKGKWRRCASPLRLKKLRPAVYVVRVRAVGRDGARDRTPAVVRFRVLRPSRLPRSENHRRRR